MNFTSLPVLVAVVRENASLLAQRTKLDFRLQSFCIQKFRMGYMQPYKGKKHSIYAITNIALMDVTG